MNDMHRMVGAKRHRQFHQYLQDDAEMTKRAFLYGVAGATLMAGCGGSNFNPDRGHTVVRSLNELLLTLIAKSTLGPPPTARAIAMVSTAMFDAFACYDPIATGTRYGSSLRQPANRRTQSATITAITHAAMHVLMHLFPANANEIRDSIASLGEDPDALMIQSSDPALIGYRVATALINYRKDDGSNASNNYVDTSHYMPVNSPDAVSDPSRWQPLLASNGLPTTFTCPHWGTVVPFALTNGSILRPRSVPEFATPAYMGQLTELLRMMETLDDRKKSIAEYWADGPKSVRPPGHWLVLAMEAVYRRNLSLRDEVTIYFAIGNAMLDASIACWDCKRYYDTSRPITAIQYLFDGKSVPSYAGPEQGIVWMDGSKWKPYQSTKFVTPPFPEYTSGHSTFSAAGATVLRGLLGSDDFGYSVTISKGSSSLEQSVPKSDVTLTFPTFTTAEVQAGLSRRYGGIHFEAADVEGRICGREVGQRVVAKVNQYVSGDLDTRAATPR